MGIFYALGIVLFGFLAIAWVIKPFIDSMMPTIAALGTPFEIAYWGLLPVLLLISLIPVAILVYRNRREK